jgi:hypothetical protein
MLAAIAERFVDITDGARRDYSCYSVVHFVETLVLATAH